MIRFVSILVAILLFCVADLAAQSSYTTEDKKAIKYYEQSALQIRGRDFNGGIELLEKALLRDPAFIEAHLRLASAYKVLLRYDLAETQYREALAVDSLSKLNFDTYFALGLMIYDKGEYKEARKYLSRYIQTNP
ncbi:tetratricopeptide repeat protein, partial [uncultured Imperialibacter sp.]